MALAESNTRFMPGMAMIDTMLQWVGGNDCRALTELNIRLVADMAVTNKC